MSKKKHLWFCGGGNQRKMKLKGEKNGGYNAWKNIGKRGEPNWTLFFWGVGHSGILLVWGNNGIILMFFVEVKHGENSCRYVVSID